MQMAKEIKDEGLQQNLDYWTKQLGNAKKGLVNSWNNFAQTLNNATKPTKKGPTGNQNEKNSNKYQITNFEIPPHLQNIIHNLLDLYDLIRINPSYFGNTMNEQPQINYGFTPILPNKTLNDQYFGNLENLIQEYQLP